MEPKLAADTSARTRQDDAFLRGSAGHGPERFRGGGSAMHSTVIDRT